MLKYPGQQARVFYWPETIFPLKFSKIVGEYYLKFKFCFRKGIKLLPNSTRSA